MDRTPTAPAEKTPRVQQHNTRSPLRFICILTCGIAFVVISLQAQTASVTGRVTDASTHQPVAGATIILNEPGLWQSTGDSGRFEFRRLAPGRYTLSVRHIGFAGKEIVVTCADGDPAILTVDLQPSPVQPGEMIIVGPEGVTRERYSPERPLAHCAFEHVYFSRPDSMVFGRPVQESREMLGCLLAREHPADADLVVPVPDSGVAAALGYSAESGLPFRHALIRNHYVGRTFIEPSQAIRDFGVKLKLNPVRYLLEGKSVVLVDDSIVRGTTSRKIVRMVRQAGAREVHLRISCPPTISPCFYGVDTPTKRELIASNNDVEAIRRFVEADTLGYLSLRALREAVGDSERHEYCYACYTGDYPTELVNIEQLLSARKRPV